MAARRANASTAGDRSIPTTVPSGATARARSSAVSPPPQPMSRTLSPGPGASAAKTCRPSGASCNSNASRTSAHALTRTSSWVSAGRGLIWSMLRSLPGDLGMSRLRRYVLPLRASLCHLLQVSAKPAAAHSAFSALMRVSPRLADHGKALFGEEMFEGAAGCDAAKHHSGGFAPVRGQASSFRHLPFPR